MRLQYILGYTMIFIGTAIVAFVYNGLIFHNYSSEETTSDWIARSWPSFIFALGFFIPLIAGILLVRSAKSRR